MPAFTFPQTQVQGGATTLTYGSPNTLGNMLIAIAAWDDATSGPLPIPTDTAGNTWVLANLHALSCGDGNSASVQVWYVPNCKAKTGNAVSVGGATPPGFEFYIDEVAGCATVSPYDSASSAGAGGHVGNAAATTGTLTSASEIIFEAVPSPSGNCTSAGTGWTLRGAISGGGTGYAYKIVSSTTAVVGAMNMSGDWVIGMAGFKAPAANAPKDPIGFAADF